MPIINQETWDKWVESNQDPYGLAIINVARRVMEILDRETEFDTVEMICRADKDVSAGGITGFMATGVAAIVSQCHSRGEEFRKAWNRNIGQATGQEDADGILNPAILNIEMPQQGN